MNERCKTCIYGVRPNHVQRGCGYATHSCDYVMITGHTRTAQISDPLDLAPERCPLYVNGKRTGRPEITSTDGIYGRKTARQRGRNIYNDAAAMEMYKNGAVDTAIAAEMGVSTAFVQHWRKTNGLPSNGKTALEKRSNKYRRLLDSGKNYKEVADEMGVTLKAVYNWIARTGWEPKNNG